MRIVIALGGNALLRQREPMTAETQRANVRRAVAALLPLFEAGHQLVITHGNGPQVGLLALQAAAGPKDGAYPLDVLDAESEGMVGYMIEQELDNALPGGRLVATLLTQILVDRRDSAFRHPTKPIGPLYDKAEATRLTEARGWTVADVGSGWRRVVPAPGPLQILEARVIELLVSQSVTVICAGGGGIPVLERSDGTLLGVGPLSTRTWRAHCWRASSAPITWCCSRMSMASTSTEGSASASLIKRAGPRALDPADFAPGSMGPQARGCHRVHGGDRPTRLDWPSGGRHPHPGRRRRHKDRCCHDWLGSQPLTLGYRQHPAPCSAVTASQSQSVRHSTPQPHPH
jgi:carbamate kinase